MDYMKTLASLSLGSRLKRLSDQLFSEVAIVYEQMGLTLNPNYFLLLNLINKMGPMGITQVAEYLAISHPAVSKIANKMIKEGYLMKHAHPTDRRASQLSLTQQSLDLMRQATPIWQTLKKHLDYLESLQTEPLLDALDQFENNLRQFNLSESVLLELKKSVQDITIEHWHGNYKDDFKRLNMEWLKREFNGELTEKDKLSIENPEIFYLAQGGYIFFAKQAQEVVGCIALKATTAECYEVSKMAVTSDIQGQGIGRLLLLTALNKARNLKIKTVSLETNSKLNRAMTLYQHFGFTQMPPPKGKSDYPRADVYMELPLYV